MINKLFLLIAPAPASCSCLLLLRTAPASCSCGLLLPTAPADCSCGLFLLTAEKETFAMITVANRIYVKQEHADAFEQRFRDRAGLVDKMPGFISNYVLRPVNEGEPYVVFTFWNSRQDFLNWVRSDEFVKGHAQSGTLPKDAFFQANVLEMHEVVQDSTRPDLPPEPRGGPFRMH